MVIRTQDKAHTFLLELDGQCNEDQVEVLNEVQEIEETKSSQGNIEELEEGRQER